MDPFEYTVVLISLILGFGLSQILMGVSDVLTHFKETKLGLQHSILVLIVFFLHIQEWWAGYSYSMTVETWTLPLVLNWLVYPVFLFVFARILFPTKIHGSVDLDEFYWSQWPRFFVMLILIAIISIIQNTTLTQMSISSQYPQFSLIIVTLLFLIFKVEKRILHTIFLCVHIIAWLVYLITDDATLGQSRF